MSKPRDDKKVDVPDNLIRELLTHSELRMVKQRYLIIDLLNQGLSIRTISQKLQVGTDTVVRVSKMRNSSLKLRASKTGGQKVLPSKWIFGQTGSKE